MSDHVSGGIKCDSHVCLLCATCFNIHELDKFSCYDFVWCVIANDSQ